MNLGLARDAAAVLLALLSGAGVVYAVVATVAVRRLAIQSNIANRMPTAAGDAAPAVTILKPLHGGDPDLLPSLATFCVQGYAGPVQIVCGVADRNDPAVAVVAKLRRAYPAVAIDLVIDPDEHGRNGKISNLINMMGVARYDLIVLSDSDIQVDRDYLARIVGVLQQPGVGVVTSLYRGVDGGSLWTELLTRAIDHHFLPSVLVGRMLGLAEPCMGSTIALSRATIERIGGFAAFADSLADDYEIGRAVCRSGLRLSLAPGLVVHVSHPDSFAWLFDQELRWQRTIRVIDPAGFAGSVVTHSLPMAILSFVVSGAAMWSFALVVAAILSRIGLVTAIDRTLGSPQRRFGLWIVRDFLSFAVFLAAFGSRKVVWRGRRLDVGADGRIDDLGAKR